MSRRRPGTLSALALLMLLSACAAALQAGDRALASKGATGQAAPGGPADTGRARGSGPPVSAEDVLGQDAPWLQARLGKPDFRRLDGPAEIWQYKNDSCVLNVFLYSNAPAAPGPKRVLHLDARAAASTAMDREACIAALQR